MTETPPGFPKRLIDDGDDAAGHLIRSVLREPAAGPNESRSFRRLDRRVRGQSPRWRLSAAALAVAAALGVGFSLQRTQHENASPSIRAEALSSAPARRLLPPRVAAAELVQRVPEAPASAPTRTDAHRTESENDTSRCAKLARAGSYDAAASCYDRIARGRTMAAELALYEKARLQSKALGDAAAGLATLEEHARRFPTGVLATESIISRIELLSRLGRTDDALTTTQQALQGPAGRERGGDLQVLRAELWATRGNCAAALEAVASARQAGAHASRLEAVERRCGEQAAPAPSPVQPQEFGR